MRLIDADELIVFGIDDQENETVFKFVPKEFIDDAPTIEAIPLSWLEEHQKYYDSYAIGFAISQWKQRKADWKEMHGE